MKLDKFDRQILEELQRDCSLSTVEIAERVGISQSPCWRRIKRLKEEGIIDRHVAVLDKSKLGPVAHIYCYLRMDTLREMEREEFLRSIDSIPEILEAYTIFGDMDILLKIVAPTVEWYQEFVFKKIQRLPGVVDLRSTITLKELKSTTSVPVSRLLED